MDLGQQRQGPECSRSDARTHRGQGRRGSDTGQESRGPEQAEKRIQGGQMSVGKHTGHDEESPAGTDSGGTAPTSAGFGGHDSDQYCKRQSGGKPAREHVKPRGVGSKKHDLKRLPQARGQAQQPASQRGVLRIVTEDSLDETPLEEPPAPSLQGGNVGAAGTHVQGFVNGQSRITQGQQDRQAGHRRRHQTQPCV